MSARAERLVELLRERELDALLVTNLVNLRYLTGFSGSNGVCIVAGGLRAFLTDFRYVEQAQRQLRGFELERGERDLLGDAAARLAAAGFHRVGFEDHHLTVRSHRRLAELLPDELELVPAGLLVEELRAVKDEQELRAIRTATRLGDEIFEHLRRSGFRGRSEREVARELDAEIRARGVEPAFDTIVAAGANGALPHATPGEEPIAPGTLVVVDLGCVVDGYCSDCTRTFATDGVGERLESVYELVREAQELALGAVRAGAGCREVDAVARDAIAGGGHGERFGHGLGHGVGLEVHEGPRLTQSAGESERLRRGNVVTVEPGVYLPGEFGVRIEDLVVVGDQGPEILTSSPKTLTRVG